MDANSTIVFNGTTTAQAIPAATYGNIKINNTAGASLDDNITIKGDLTLENGTLDTKGKTITGTSGKTFQVNNGATFKLSGASTFPTTFGTVTLKPESTVNFSGTGIQTIPSYTYGHITVNNGSGVSLETKSPTYTLNVNGNLEIENGTLNNNGNEIAGSGKKLVLGVGATLNLTGSTTFPQGFGTVSLESTSNVAYMGQEAQDIKGGIIYGNLITGGRYDKRLSGNVTATNIFLTSDNEAILHVGGNAITLSGSLTGKDINFSEASTINFVGTSGQDIPGFNYGNLNLTGTGIMKLKSMPYPITAGTTTIAGPVNFAEGGIDIGEKTLTLETNGSIIGASASNYVQLTTGKMVVKGLGTGGVGGRDEAFAFPVGTATITTTNTVIPGSYTPAYIKNTGDLNEFSVNVADGIKKNGSNGSLITYNVVKKTWNVNRETSNGAVNVTLKLQWNTSDESHDMESNNTFDRNSSTINHFHQNAWESLLTSPSSDANGVYSVSASGINTFSPFVVSGYAFDEPETALPVELVNFSASKENNRALLEWSTASEKNNAGFHIQASRDGRAFETVGFVASKEANSSSQQQYRFAEEKSRTGMWYFRLKQADFSGDVSYSAAKVLNFGKVQEAVTVYPNPFRDELKVAVNLPAASEVSLELRDLTGKTVYFQTQKLAAGANLVPVTPEAGQPAGVYFLTVKTPVSSTTCKVIMQ